MNKYLLPLFALVLVACGGASEGSDSDEEKIRDEVRNYLFLGDTIEIAANITDTILVDDLDGMLATIEDNLMKIQWDIDTLNSMIDELAYAEENEVLGVQNIGLARYEEMKSKDKVLLLEYRLKMSEFKTKKMSFKQTKRVMLHLRRDQLNSIAGYEISASYQHDEEEVQLAFLMTADFKIVD